MYTKFKVGDIVTLKPEYAKADPSIHINRFIVRNVENFGFADMYFCINIFSDRLDVEDDHLMMADQTVEAANEQFIECGVVTLHKKCKNEDIVVELWQPKGSNTLYKTRCHYTCDYIFRDMPNAFNSKSIKKRKLNISEFEIEVKKYLQLGYKIL